MKLTDQDLMPFGKHHGQLMMDVPADWFLWLWDEAGLWNRAMVQAEGYTDKTYMEKRLAVHDYIRESFSALETECPDRIIAHRP